jgi:tRNA nucleotidyltransferase (CCA-adding enzyme)
MTLKIDKSKIPSNAILTCKMLQDAGYEAYLVGGCVRDLLLGESPKDFDITTNATPEESKKIFSPKKEGDKYPKYYETGIEHGTITVALGPDQNTDHFEVTVYRSEGDYTDGRRPDEVFFEKNLIKDLERRDLTINAIAYDPVNDVIKDPFDGQKDLKNKKIKAVGSADKRFQEDGLRTMRAARFAARFNFSLEDDTKKAISNNLTTLEKVSKERLQDELMKTLKTKDPQKGLEILQETGCTKLLGEGLANNPELNANINKLNLCSNPISRISLLFNGVSPEAVENNLRFLKFSNSEIKKITFLVKKITELKSKVEELKDSINIKKFITAFKNEAKEDYDRLIVDFAEIARALDIPVEKILQSGSEEIITEKDFKKIINGSDLISIGVPAGPFIKEILSKLYDRVISGELSLDKGKLHEEAEIIWESKKKQAKLNKRKRMFKIAML